MTLVSPHRLSRVAIDAVFVGMAWWLAFAFRFDMSLPVPYERLFERTLLLVVGIKVVVFVAFGLYQHWWRYVSVRDMWQAVRAVGIGSLVALLAVYIWNPVPGFRVPSAVFVLDLLILLALVTGSRLLARTLMERPEARNLIARGKEVLIVGAGDAGGIVIKEMQKKPQLGYTPIGLVDDNPRKRGMRLHGVRVLGSTGDLDHLVAESRPDEVIIAIPSAAGETRQRIVNACRKAGVPVKTLPAVHELIADDADLARHLRDVQVEDVLGRDPVHLDVMTIASYLENEVVLVTGAGGSIGSELCRQIAAVRPSALVLVDIAETPLVEIHRELSVERDFPAAVPVLADVANETRMREVFARFRPSIVFHAAAYKHVPLVETNPLEAVRNNALATKRLAQVASELATKRLVLVSTDKAVNPSNVLGQTKALCEWIVANADGADGNGTRFIAVRFGNVLGSSGSVIPLFKRQIANGGPLTVTDAEVTRYFMTVPEAAHLVIQAGAIGERGDVFVLDMGSPVSIVELARKMIRLSGKEPERDIPIEFIGMRPGEKLHEELWSSDEDVVATVHPKIVRCISRPVDPAWLERELLELERLVDAAEVEEVAAKLGEIAAVPRRVAEPAREPVPVARSRASIPGV